LFGCGGNERDAKLCPRLPGSRVEPWVRGDALVGLPFGTQRAVTRSRVSPNFCILFCCGGRIHK
jgi:hypothetical protein